MSKLDDIVDDLDKAIALYMVLQVDPEPLIVTELSNILDKLKELRDEQIDDQSR